MEGVHSRLMLNALDGFTVTVMVLSPHGWVELE
jgi:hypothetical protein